MVAFVKYSLIRLALFAPLFALFVFLQLGWLLAVVCAGLIAFAISYLFFQKQRDAATAALHTRLSGRAKPLRTAGEVADAEAEDRLVDSHPDITVRNDTRKEAPLKNDPRSQDPRSKEA
jgi:Protein of unknown function (DUF4229)